MKRKFKHLTLPELLLCALFSALIAVGAFIRIPVPVIPFTLQTFFVALSGLILGAKGGAASAALYMLLGLAGLPVFTQGGGINYIFKPSFGYIIGFCFASYITGKISHKVSAPSYKRLISANFAGMAALHIIGLSYYYIICNFVINTPIAIGPIFLYCFLMTAPGDIVLYFLSAGIAKRLIPIMQKIKSE